LQQFTTSTAFVRQHVNTKEGYTELARSAKLLQKNSIMLFIHKNFPEFLTKQRKRNTNHNYYLSH